MSYDREQRFTDADGICGGVHLATFRASVRAVNEAQLSTFSAGPTAYDNPRTPARAKRGRVSVGFIVLFGGNSRRRRRTTAKRIAFFGSVPSVLVRFGEARGTVS